MKSNITKYHILILLANIIYLLISLFVFLNRSNHEFLLYIGVVVFFVLFISLLHLKFNFSYGVLIGLSIWGLLHMLGGLIIFDGLRLYGHYFYFLRYDQIIHLFGFGFATLFGYYLLKPSLSKKPNWFVLSILLILVGIGLGGLNEIIEFIIVLAVPETGIGGYENTMWDMVFNLIGAGLAVIWINLRRIKE